MIRVNLARPVRSRFEAARAPLCVRRVLRIRPYLVSLALLLGCSAPFTADPFMAPPDAAPDASDAGPDAPREAAWGDAGDAAPDALGDDDATDARAEAAPDAAPDAGPDAPPGDAAPPDADAGPCTMEPPGSFTCGSNIATIVSPGDWCRLQDQTSTGAPVATPPACQCMGEYTCACLLATLTPAELCPSGTLDSCGNVSGSLVVRCMP